MRTRSLLLAATMLTIADPVVARADNGPPILATLAPGGSVFWEAGYAADGHVADPTLCGTAGQCWRWRLQVIDGGGRLRVAIDTPSREDTFDFAVISPTGVSTTSNNGNQFNAEVFVAKPAAGVWTVEARPDGATRAALRMRAKLDGPAGTRGRDPQALLLPNLRSVPPYEFGFVAPVNPNGLYPPDNANPPLEAAGQHPVSCEADESAEDGVSRCLRLTAGPMNAGEGPFEMQFTHVDDVMAGAPPRIFQHVTRVNGKQLVRDGGTYSFHKTHTHYHYDDILTYELYRVADSGRGRLAKVGSGHKSGFCPADQLFAEWESFAQAPAGSFGEGDSAAGNCFSPTEGLLGLSVGWGDIYRWQRPGQYVDFGANGDGLYVVRTTVDKENRVLESDETDNASFALVRVVGDRVDIIERGRGASPWDSRKVVYRGAGPSARA